MPLPCRWVGGALVALLLSAGACGGTAPAREGGDGWQLTVYYTVVEAYHGEPYESISDCAGAPLGTHSSEFLLKVRTEGFGRLALPVSGRAYLGWSFDRRCWLLSGQPVGARDEALRPWRSAAAGPAIALGTRARVARCGAPIEPRACERVKAAEWVVEDRFGGAVENRRHLDLYIGEEEGARFEADNPYYFDARGADVKLS
jgi:hypothetical protein